MTSSRRSANDSGVSFSRCLRLQAAQRPWARSAKPLRVSESGLSSTWRYAATRLIDSARSSELISRLESSAMSTKSRQRVLAVPRCKAVTISRQGSVRLCSRQWVIGVPPRSRGSWMCCGSGQSGSPMLKSTWNLTRAVDKVPDILALARRRCSLHGSVRLLWQPDRT